MIKSIYGFFQGIITIEVEGFFIERFLNICKNKNIVIHNMKKVNSTYVVLKVYKSDFDVVKSIAQKTKCNVKIIKKSGLIFIILKYRKRKVIAIAGIVIAIFIFAMTRFIWNIEIMGNDRIETQEILNIVSSYGISKGKLKTNLNFEKISNLIRLEREDISWIGIKMKGTSVIIEIDESIEKPEIIDENEICNIIASEDSEISKITVLNGTARVNIGDKVKKGDLLVEGIMEGTYAEDRLVHANATIFGKIYCEKELKENFVQIENEKTGKHENKSEICINNFKINFNKGVSKFENYDTITTNKKVKLFTFFELPIEIKKITNYEYIPKQISYTQEELQRKIELEIDEELNKDFGIYNIDEKFKKRDVYTKEFAEGISVKIVYELQKEITAKEKIE